MAERAGPMQMEELTRRLREVERSVFRLETLSRYTAPGEADLLRAFREGVPLPPRRPDTDPWLRMVADSVESGREWSRVHVLQRPLTEYLRFELLGYQGNLAAGEDVRIADRDDHRGALDPLREDFWLLDDTLAVVVSYDSDGRRLSMRPSTDAHEYIDQRDLALRHSVSLMEYLPLVQDELRRAW